jgi:hypothetical protein
VRLVLAHLRRVVPPTFLVGVDVGVGILHPLADRPFGRCLLPGIQFGEVRIDQTTGRLYTSWPREEE